MRSFKMIAAGLLAAASSAAIAAPPATHGSADGRFGAQVSTSAKAQRTGSRKGLGANVSAAAHARNAARVHRTTGGGTGSDDSTTAAGSTDTRFGSQVSAMARGQRTSTARRGLGTTVSAAAHARNAARVHGTTGRGTTSDGSTTAAGASDSRFGSQVSEMARGQRTSTAPRGLGASVSSAAHARNAARLHRSDGADDDATDTSTLATTTTTRAAQGQASFGAEVSAMARSQSDTRGIGSVVRDLPKPSETHAAHSDIAATVSQAQTARSDAAAARSDAASARADASAARSTAADASATGKQIAQDAKAIRDIVKANRPGKGH